MFMHCVVPHILNVACQSLRKTPTIAFSLHKLTHKAFLSEIHFFSPKAGKNLCRNELAWLLEYFSIGRSALTIYREAEDQSFTKMLKEHCKIGCKPYRCYTMLTFTHDYTEISRIFKTNRTSMQYSTSYLVVYSMTEHK